MMLNTNSNSATMNNFERVDDQAPIS